MVRIESIDAAELRDHLRDVNEAKPAQRLMVAIAYKEGVSQSELSEWFGYSRKTIYNWFNRMEEEPLAEAIRDDPRPGRPPQLDESDRQRLRSHLRDPPRKYGFNVEAWNPNIVRKHIEEEFDVHYSSKTARRLLMDLGE